jgi:hypothetical protein
MWCRNDIITSAQLGTLLQLFLIVYPARPAGCRCRTDGVCVLLDLHKQGSTPWKGCLIVRLPVILQPVMKLIKWHRLNHAKFSSSMLVFSHRRKLCSARHGAAHMHAVAHHCKLVLVIVRPERLTNM